MNRLSWLLLAVSAAPALADVPIPTIPASHPRVLLVGAELQRFRDDLAAQRPAIKRFKEQVVDAQVAGADIYGYEPWYSAFMGVITQQPQYCAHAVQMTDAHLDAEAAKIQAGEYPDARADSYLFIGDVVGNVALVYDWCFANLNATQKLRWGNYADRFTTNVWNQATNQWGVPTPANNYSWDGTVKPAGSGWSVDNPVNNYYYSFLRATMLWGLVSKHEPGRPLADGFLQKFRNEKIQNQLVPVFGAQLTGGGSREGTGYGTAMGALFALYHLWEKTTGERIADVTPHTSATMPYMLHAIAPTRDKLAPIGDHARDSSAELYDYHRAKLLALASLFAGTPMARNVRDFLAASSRPQMGDRFNWINDVLYDRAETTAPSALNTTYHAPGTGHIFTRTSWATNATWLSFLASAYSESHAHADGLSLLLYKNGWLVHDANREAHSGLAQGQEAHGLVRQRRVSDNVDLPMYANANSKANLRALAVKAQYTYFSADSGTLFVHPSQGDKGVRASREIVHIKPDTFIVFDRAEYTPGATVKTFQLPTPGAPTVAGRIATYGNGTSTLQVRAVSPTHSVLAATDMRTVDADYLAGYRIDSSVTSSGPTQFLHVLGIDGAVTNAVRGANDGAATVTLADGRVVTVAFDPLTPGGTIEIRGPANQVLVSETLPTTVQALNVFETTGDLFSDATEFARQQYRDFLGREGDAGGVAHWANQITIGAQSRAQMVETFFNSAEFQGQGAPVARLYFAYLLRIPDYGGLNYWIGQFRGGQSLIGISNAFAASPEFIARYGTLTNAQFIDRVYQNVLGRAPDSAGLAYWTGQLNGGMTRGQLMVAFSESPEYRALIGNEVYVTMMYVGMLRRAPDTGGFSHWVSYMDAGNTGLALIQGFLDSTEYRGRFGL